MIKEYLGVLFTDDKIVDMTYLGTDEAKIVMGGVIQIFDGDRGAETDSIRESE